MMEEDDFFCVSTERIFPRTILSGQLIKVVVSLPVKEQSCESLQKLPFKKEFRIITREETIVLNFSLNPPILPYVNWLKTLPDRKLLVWGQVGTGKSSFINSVASLYNTEGEFEGEVLGDAYSSQQSSSVTSSLRSYTYDNLTLFDTWGWEHASEAAYSDSIFQAMLDGQLPDGYEMTRALNFSIRHLLPEPCKIDIPIFAISTTAANDDAFLEVFNRFVRLAVQDPNGLKPVILLTQVDKTDPKLREDPYSFNEQITPLIQQLFRKTGIDINNILPIVNYSEEYETNWYMDRAAFVVLFRCFSSH